MKSMLRNSYSEIGKSNSKTKKMSRNMVNITTNESDSTGKRLGTVVGVKNGETEIDFTDCMEGPRFNDFGGMKDVLQELKSCVIHPIYYSELLKHLGVKSPMTGILLHGPPGCGKTRLARAIANVAGVPFYQVAAPELVSSFSGASEENIRELFSKACRTAPSIIFIDEIDAIASRSDDARKGMENRIVTQLMTCMDAAPGYVFIIGATNKPDALEPALRRPGRFDKEICIPVPDENTRAEILSILTRDLRLESSFNLLKTARSTPDEEGAENYLRQAWLLKDNNKLKITFVDFEKAIKEIQPSLKRDGFFTIPNIKWEDVGGLDHIRERFDFDMVKAIKYPKHNEKFGVNPNTGYLLYGPPGCGKTLIAKAVANEAGANFIYIKGPELLNKYVGESELAVHTLFHRARTCSPCIIFFDEVEKRGKEGGWVVEQPLNQMKLYLRPGRIDELLYVPRPGPDERGLILKAFARKHPIDSNVDLIKIRKMRACHNLSGADLAELVKKAAKAAIRESEIMDTTETIKASHFEKALGEIRSSIR